MRFRLWVCILPFLNAGTTLAQKVTWVKTGDTELIFSSENRALFAHPNGDLLVGTTDWLGCGDYCWSEGKVFRSLDDGQTWEQTSYDGDGVTSFAAWPNGDVVLSSLEHLYRSSDRGETWTETSTPESWSWNYALHVTADSAMYLGLGPVPGTLGGGLIRSADGGQTWEEQIGGPSPTNPFLPPPFYEFLELGDGTLLAASDLGVFRLEPEGAWTHSGPDSTRIDNLAGVPEGLVYASSPDAIYRSDDSGATWQATELPSAGVSDIAVNDRGDLFASTGTGLYGSKTNGDEWERLGEAIGPLVATSDDHLVSASKRGGGLYRTSSPVLLPSERDGEIVPKRVQLDQNYPNPFSERTTIVFTLAQPSSVMLEVFDLTGRRVATLVDAATSTGRHTVRFDAANLAAGAYIYRLSTGANIKTGRMMAQ